MRLLLLLVLACCAEPPPGTPPPAPVLVLPYDAFGPQAMSFGLVGFGWWQWEAGGSFGPGDTFDIRVVVHRDGERDLAARVHPTVPGVWDRRYVSRSDALAYLDRSLAELAQMGGFEALTEELRHTRAAIAKLR